MTAPIDFFFEFASPYGYLASLRIDSIAVAYEREVVWRPIMLGAAFKASGSVPNAQAPLRGPYFFHDVPRSARLMNAPLVMPPTVPMNSLAASRTYWWLFDADQDIARGFAQALFQAHWGEGRDMSTVDQVLEVAGTFGIGADELQATLADPAIKQRLKDETDRAIAAGVFGSPFVIVDGEPFWGADRLDQVERWLATGGW
ncbi:2-hydroxychromene-2-carboxylate isomerase [Geminicoccus flavidas]|uniref:2-hydroxychromene-2-carboxylate isomerase n=1 Tax=Geminicoccus flavidas TaxID=2506407 RepID=UPI001358F046|nr:2-hydroxychromene-2-carboxylate isomerase [Geminicoccus flavidas]